MMAAGSYIAPFQLLELNIISAQDLEKVSHKMKTYGVVWIHPEHKLYTRIDTGGHNNPTWNDKFVFRVDNNFLHDDLSAINIEIYATNWWRNVFVGSVRLLVGNLLEPGHAGRHFLGMQFVALQVRRPSSRFQGILNIGLALLDSSMRSMPLYSHAGTSAMAYRDLMGEGYPLDNQQNDAQIFQKNDQARELRRTKSDTSSIVVSNIMGGSMMDNCSVIKGRRGAASSMVGGSETSDFRGKNFKAGSWVSGSMVSDIKGKKIKGGSCVSGSDVGYMQKYAKSYKGSSILSASDIGRYGRAGSMLTGSAVNFPTRKGKNGIQDAESRLITIKELVHMKRDDQNQQNGSEIEWPKPRTKTKFSGSDVHAPIITESELGPSPSEVAAAIEKETARNGYKRERVKNNASATRWSLDTSVEGLQSKLERWRAELPTVHDQSDYSSLPSVPYSGISGSSRNTRSKHRRRHTDGEGLVSCFGNLCGVQVSIVCGAPADSAKKKDKSS